MTEFATHPVGAVHDPAAVDQSADARVHEKHERGGGADRRAARQLADRRVVGVVAGQKRDLGHDRPGGTQRSEASTSSQPRFGA